MNYEKEIITIEDCIESWEKKDNGVILQDGQVTGFENDWKAG